MAPHFNLAYEPWIPCIQADGQAIDLSLRDALVEAHELQELAGDSPLVTAALYRLLLAVLHRIFGPPGSDAWESLWQAGSWDRERVNEYLAAWQHQLDLFDAERPFYQVADRRVKPKSVCSLVHEFASGNNATLFDHHMDDEDVWLAPAQAARLLVTAQSFGLAGLSGLPQKFTDGSCTRGVIFLVQGNTLFQSLALNLLRYPDDGFFVGRSGDRPAWEMDDPHTPERSVPLGYLDYLTWQNRRILLLPEANSGGIRVRQMTVAPGLRLDAGVLDTMKHYRKDEKRGPLPRRFNEDRALWRDSAALFKLHSGGWRPPVTFDWLAELVHMGVLSKTLTERTLALGMANKQAKVEFYRSERLALPLAYLQDRSLVESLDTALGMAEDVGRRLWGAGRRLATYLLSPVADAPDARQPKREDLDQVMGPWGIERIYWSRLEVEFRTTMERIPRDTEGALDAWQTVLRRTAWDAIEHAARLVGTDPRGFKAIVRAREQLALGLSRLFPRDDRQDVLAESNL